MMDQIRCPGCRRSLRPPGGSVACECAGCGAKLQLDPSNPGPASLTRKLIGSTLLVFGAIALIRASWVLVFSPGAYHVRDIVGGLARLVVPIGCVAFALKCFEARPTWRRAEGRADGPDG